MEHFLTEVLQPVISAVLQIIAVAAVGFFINLIRKKTSIEISQDSRKKLEASAVQAVLAIEEEVASNVKEHIHTWTSEDKHREAVDQILRDVPAVSEEKADQMVRWALAKIRGLGATKDDI